jgi:dihydroorotase/N-acyl-D-amino-acid deacylase
MSRVFAAGLHGGLVVALCGCASAHTARTATGPTGVAAASYDVIIENGRIVDGTGNAWFYGDVGIRGDRIARVTPAGVLSGARAVKRIDARNLVVSPGFIDIQGQSVSQLTFGDSRLVSKVTQGVTTEILGEGNTPAPVNDNILKSTEASFTGPRGDSIRKVVSTFTGEHGFGRWLDAMQAHGMSVNAGSFLGAETIRVYAKGFAEGDPNAAELDTMRMVTRNAMRDGAFGVASALIYPPGNFATTDELIEIAKAMSPLGGVYITHMRSEGDRLLEALDEAMRIGKEGRVPVEIYHLKAAGVRNWPKMDDAIAKIEYARAYGQDVSADMYPYVAGGTGLAACTPPWATANDKLLDNLRDPDTRKRIVAEMHEERTSWENLCNLATPKGVMVVGFTSPEMQKYEGKRIEEIATDMKKDWAEAVADMVLAEKGGPGIIVFLMSEENVATQLTLPWMKIGTDASGLDPDSARGLAHPRAYGTFPRILGQFVRERRLMTLEDAVRKMTSAVADRLSLQGRGVLREGMYADIAIWDPVTIIDHATFIRPHQISEGVKHVFVNGVQVLDDGRHTGAKPGKVVRGPGWEAEGEGKGKGKKN